MARVAGACGTPRTHSHRRRRSPDSASGRAGRRTNDACCRPHKEWDNCPGTPVARRRNTAKANSLLSWRSFFLATGRARFPWYTFLNKKSKHPPLTLHKLSLWVPHTFDHHIITFVNGNKSFDLFHANVLPRQKSKEGSISCCLRLICKRHHTMDFERHAAVRILAFIQFTRQGINFLMPLRIHFSSSLP